MKRDIDSGLAKDVKKQISDVGKNISDVTGSIKRK